MHRRSLLIFCALAVVGLLAFFGDEFCARCRAAKLYNLGISLSADGQFDRAIADFNESIRLDSKYAPAFNARGFAYRGKGDLDRAIANSSAAIQIDPKFTEAYVTRGDTYRAKGDVNHAISDYTEALRIDGNYYNAFYSRANLYQTEGELDHAIADYEMALKTRPSWPEALKNLSMVKAARAAMASSKSVVPP
jgi:tetratricopeptide (TPR) repeat protein